VVELHAGEILVRGLDQLAARHALGLGDGLQPDRMRSAARLDAPRRFLVAHDLLLGLDDASVANLEPQRDQRRRFLLGIAMVLVDRSDDGDLPRLDVADEEAIVALRLHRVPQPVADLEALTVLGEARVRRERHLARVVVDHRVEITLDEAFETGSIARLPPSRTRRRGAQANGGRKQLELRSHPLLLPCRWYCRFRSRYRAASCDQRGST